jgi:hypothetical protein
MVTTTYIRFRGTAEFDEIPGQPARRGLGLGVGLGGFFLQAGAVAGNGPFDGVGQVVQQVPAISDLDGERRAAGCSF